MASYNKVLLMGNLTRDPALKYLPNQTPVVDFGVACNRKYKLQSGEEREEVTFVDCAAFGRTAEVINQYFQKGKPIFIEGEKAVQLTKGDETRTQRTTTDRELDAYVRR